MKRYGFAPFGATHKEVYAKDLKEGVLYRSRFGFTVYIKDGQVYKLDPRDEPVKIYPAEHSIFIEEKRT